MMKKLNIKKFVLLVATAFFMTSCFDIKETVKLNSDGTGTYSFVLDMSQLKELFMASRTMAKGMLADSMKNKGYAIKTPSPIDQIKPKFDAFKNDMLAIKGISNYETVYDTINFIIGAKFDFANDKALNMAITKMQTKKEDALAASKLVHFTFNDKLFERFNTISPEDFNTFQSKDSLSKSMSAKVKYSIEYKFDKKIKSYENVEYYMNGDATKVIFSGYLQDLIRGKGTIANKIKF